MPSKPQNPPLISILVPIYNVEPYLSQCLDSLVNQTLKDLEIICINDGSTDNSLQIIQSYMQKDSRIRLLDKPNSGYGDSMNQGIKIAQGHYIGIVEPDDWIDLDAFEKLCGLATLNNADVVRANYYYHQSDHDQKHFCIKTSATGKVVDPRQETWIFYEAPAIWSAIYRRDFLIQNRINFLPTPGASYQDTGFNFKVWASAQRAYFTPHAFLHYRIDNENSSVNNPGKVMNVCYEYAEIEKYLREQKLFDRLSGIMEASKFGAYYWNLFRLQKSLLPEFIDKTRAEFQTAANKNYLDRSCFEPYKWNLLQYILAHKTSQVIHHIELFKLKSKLRNFAKHFWLKTHPTYRKVRETSELITELSAEQIFLRAKLESLPTPSTKLESLPASNSSKTRKGTNA